MFNTLVPNISDSGSFHRLQPPLASCPRAPGSHASKPGKGLCFIIQLQKPFQAQQAIFGDEKSSHYLQGKKGG
jgi:hypothetical protein